ncbi:uncharacterized protein LOC128859449 [Anastrepha ludens]|uniref:uncharacterized protein LOC128859449 n=1 Tax=Anastrepha ludens TaxID=28586 RepID=UPI0023AFCAF1|nr:uncharacterized protein LOC128859449 [Anastrepha ludens]
MYRGIVHSHMGRMTKLCWFLLLTLILRHHATNGIEWFTQKADCGPRVSDYPRNCAHGVLKFNMNRTLCRDSLVCYSNLGEDCQDFGAINNCLPGLFCSCGRCREMVTICRERLRSPMYITNNISESTFPEQHFRIKYSKI